MPSAKKLEELRTMKEFFYSYFEKDGVPMCSDGKREFVIPTFIEMRKEIFTKIRLRGFSKIETVPPNKANCIIRVFKKTHYEYDDSIYNVYGFVCYTRSAFLQPWLSQNSMSGETFPIDFSKCIQRLSICQDEYIDFDLDFFDCYVRVS